MGSGNLTRLLLQKILCSRRKLHSVAIRIAHADDVRPVKEKLKNDEIPGESNCVCIYKVPPNMRLVKKKAYEPSIVSIGPYHHGEPRLQAMEELKWRYFHRLFNPKQQHGVELEPVMEAMEKLEEKAQSCYSDEVKLSKGQFAKMMLIDGCFIIELFKELNQKQNFTQQKLDIDEERSLIKRWMLPTLRRDLIMLENQLPLFVLCELFQLITNSSSSTKATPSLQELALRFFNPLFQRNHSGTQENQGNQPNLDESTVKGFEGKHFLDLFRSSILPNLPEKDARGKQTHMMRSISELKEVGVEITTAKNHQSPLDISFGKWKLNRAKDVGLLHYKGILYHSLGSNREVAKLVNNLCKEVVPDNDESYLYKVVNNTNSYFNTWYARKRAVLVHHYFSSWLVGISTLGAIFALYLTLIQTASGVASALGPLHDNNFCSYIRDSILLPFSGNPSTLNGPTVGEINQSDKCCECLCTYLENLLKGIDETKND
ncbi:hypothetical protein RGQ29_032463 [Quercus rubra]|uniref:Uncharacterized protein n=1 Tax=Quercus rubra TaxID=3512 RepID=A0AAN7DVG4_QUERU|nr:hypothetical protein RGQ29_032463 [Quercus rubra]